MKTWTNRQSFQRYRFELTRDLKWQRLRWELAGERPAELDLQRRLNLPLDLRNLAVDPQRDGYRAKALMLQLWSRRYAHRRNAIRGYFPMFTSAYARSRLADFPAQQALMLRHRQHEAHESRRVPAIAAESAAAERMELGHGYGPSLRMLWWEAKRAGLSDDEAWQHVVEWSVRIPSADADDDAALTPHKRQKIAWRRSDGVEPLWEAERGGEIWRLRLNDFPDEPMYRLVIGNRLIGDFHDWPGRWQRADDPHATPRGAAATAARGSTIDPAMPPSNAAAFAEYRRRSETALAGLKAWLMIDGLDYSRLAACFRDILLSWLARYRRRQEAIAGLADALGRDALAARNRRRDARAIELPDWNWAIESFLTATSLRLQRNSPDERRLLAGFRIESLAEPHDYGPSIRSLWSEAKRQGLSEADAWRHVMAWAAHTPAAWRAEERSLAIDEPLRRAIAWGESGDSELPWTATVDGSLWQIRLNDFPEAPLYGLLTDGAHRGDFHDWPESWSRDAP